MYTPSPIMRFFDCKHLPADLQQVAMPISHLATQMDATLRESAEKSAGLRKLLEAKDCFVRSAIPAPPTCGHCGQAGRRCLHV